MHRLRTTSVLCLHWISAATLGVLVAVGSSVPEGMAQAAPASSAAAFVQRHCLECHGPDTQEGDLRLDTLGHDLSQPKVAARWRDVADRIRAGDMPPEERPRPGAAETAAVLAWIDHGLDAGRAAGGHWAFQPLRDPPVPEVPLEPRGLRDWIRNDIDRFIVAKQATRAATAHAAADDPRGHTASAPQPATVTPSPEADRITLIRRVTFDLIGLPPTPAEVAAFLADAAPDAWERVVDRLLASPHYGERWGRHWLDLAQYADSSGYDKDQPRRNAWPYRDYVIRALNADKPYARFLTEQIAGDVLHAGTRDGEEAIGFIAAGPWDQIGHREVPETKTDGKIARHLDRDDMVANTIGTFASVTIHCAQCHNHKFDPITQDDYYSLQAVFAAVDRDDRRYSLDPELTRRVADLQGRKAKAESRRKELQKKIGPRLAEIEKELATVATTKVKNPGPSSGYHSSISPTPDAAKWVQVDLGGDQGIREVILRPCFDTFNNIGAGFGFPRRFRVEVSNDPEFKTGIATVVSREDADVPNPGVEGQSYATGATGRYVRITATKLAPRSSSLRSSSSFSRDRPSSAGASPSTRFALRHRGAASIESSDVTSRPRATFMPSGEITSSSASEKMKSLLRGASFVAVIRT